MNEKLQPQRSLSAEVVAALYTCLYSMLVLEICSTRSNGEHNRKTGKLKWKVVHLVPHSESALTEQVSHDTSCLLKLHVVSKQVCTLYHEYCYTE